MMAFMGTVTKDRIMITLERTRLCNDKYRYIVRRKDLETGENIELRLYPEVLKAEAKKYYNILRTITK